MADREVMLDFGLEEVLKSLSEFGISRALKWEQKGVIATLVTGKHLLAVLPTGFGKGLIFQVLVRVKEIMTGTTSSVVVVFPLQSIVCDQMEEASSMGLTAATLTKSRLKDIECSKYNLVFASAEEVLAKSFLSLFKNAATPFHQNMCAIIVDDSYTVETCTGQRFVLLILF